MPDTTHGSDKELPKGSSGWCGRDDETQEADVESGDELNTVSSATSEARLLMSATAGQHHTDSILDIAAYSRKEATCSDPHSDVDDWKDYSAQCLMFFPLLWLPAELIERILSFLPVGDRWKARVCKALYEIEEGKMWRADSLIFEGWAAGIDPTPFEVRIPSWLEEYEMEEVEAALHKMTRNLHFGRICADVTDEHERFVVPLVQKMQCDSLRCYLSNYEFSGSDPAMETRDSTLPAWLAGRTSIVIGGDIYFTGEAMAGIFNDMENGRGTLKQLGFEGWCGPAPEDARKFLKLIGIRWEHGFKSSRGDIEIYSQIDGVQLTEDNHEKFVHLGANTSHHLFILVGWTLKVAVRKWVATNKIVLESPRDCSMAIERYDEDGSPPPFKSFFGLDISDIRNGENFFRIPVVYE